MPPLLSSFQEYASHQGNSEVGLAAWLSRFVPPFPSRYLRGGHPTAGADLSARLLSERTSWCRDGSPHEAFAYGRCCPGAVTDFVDPKVKAKPCATSIGGDQAGRRSRADLPKHGEKCDDDSPFQVSRSRGAWRVPQVRLWVGVDDCQRKAQEWAVDRGVI